MDKPLLFEDKTNKTGSSSRSNNNNPLLLLLGESPNPLLIHTVIKEVSHYLSSADLKQCRLVCKQWDEELSRILRKVTFVPLPSDKKLQEFFDGGIVNHTFCSNYQLGQEVTLNLNNQEGDGSSSSSLARKFLLTYGPFIQTLYLDNCKWSREDLLSIIYQFCPNLEEYCLVGSGVEDGLFPGEDGQSSSSSLSPRLVKNIKCLRVNLICSGCRIIRNTKLMGDLLQIMPNVETISWIDTYMDEVRYDRNFQLDWERAWCARPQENGITIRDTICDTAIHRKDIGLRKLSRIESNTRLNNESIQVLAERNFPLTYLDISLTVDVETNVLSSMLTSLSSTLVTLRLEFYPTHGTNTFFGFQFPKMKKLENIFLQKFPSSFSFCRNFCAGSFPSLKSLTFCETDFQGMVENDEIVGCSSSRSKNKESLGNESIRVLQVACDMSKHDLSNQGINKLANFLPNLEEVRMENFESMDKSFWELSFPKLRYFGLPSEKALPSSKGEKVLTVL